MLAFEQTRPKTGQRLRFGARTTIFCNSNLSTKNNSNEHSLQHSKNQNLPKFHQEKEIENFRRKTLMYPSADFKL